MRRSTLLSLLLLLPFNQYRAEDCFNGLEYVVVEQLEVAKEEAAILCSQTGSNFSLVTFQSEEEFDFAIELAKSIALETGRSVNFWTGFERTDPESAINDPVSFGVTPGGFASEFGEDPWTSAQPLSDISTFFQAGRNGDCVRVSMPEEDLISRSCSDPNFALCTRPCETRISFCNSSEQKEYLYIPERMDFFTFVSTCESFEPAASMAKPTSESEFSILDDFMRETNAMRNYWIGYFMEDEEADVSDPLSYNIGISSFGGSRGVAPWEGEDNGNIQPGVSLLETDDHGVQVDKSSRRWQVEDAFVEANALCERACTQTATSAESSNILEMKHSFWLFAGVFGVLSGLLLLKLTYLNQEFQTKKQCLEAEQRARLAELLQEGLTLNPLLFKDIY